MDHSDSIPRHILEDVRQNFGFLLDKGYEIVSTAYDSGYYDGYWEVLFKSPTYFLNIVNDQAELILSFGTSPDSYLNVGSIIYFLSGEKEVLGASAGMKKYAGALMKYLDEIETRFRDDHAKFDKDVRSTRKKYEGRVQRSSTWLIASIIYGLLFIVCFNIYDELVLGWLLSEWLLNYGYSLPGALLKVVSFLLAAGTVYVINQAVKKPADAPKNQAIFTEPRPWSRRSLILLAIILFPVYLLFFAVIISLALSGLSLDSGGKSFFSITTWVVSILLALWVAVAIIRSSKSG